MKKLFYSFVAALTVVSLSAGPAFAAQASKVSGPVSSSPGESPEVLCQKRVDVVNNAIDNLQTFIDVSYKLPTDLTPYEARQTKDLVGQKVTIHRSVYKSADKKDIRNGKTNLRLVQQRLEGALGQAKSIVYKSGEKKGKPAFDTAQMEKDVTLLKNSIDAGETLSVAARSTIMPGYTYEKGKDYGVNLGLAGWKSDEKHVLTTATFTVELNKAKCNDKAYQQNMKFLSKQRAIVVRALNKHIATTVKTNIKSSSKDFSDIVKERNKIKKNIEIKK